MSTPSSSLRASGAARFIDVAWLRHRPHIGSEVLILLASLYFTVFSNGAFWHQVLPHPLAQWQLGLALLVILSGLHALLLALLVPTRAIKPVLAVLILVTAVVSHYMSAYGIYFDADMLRNILHTDRKEASELVTWRLLIPVILALLPVAVLTRVQLIQRPRRRALLVRAGFVLAVGAATALAAMLAFQPLSSLMRNQHEVRYLVAPANYLVSLVTVLGHDEPVAKPARTPVGLDARQVPAATGRKPRLLVLVVGETARAANWGLDGYERNTTPELAQANVINFSQVSSCGSATEVSLPCMFSRIGRHDYDEKAIRQQQSLLHVLDHAGIATLWRDNQSGCKHVCDGLPTQALDDTNDPRWCDGKRCLDEILLQGLAGQVATPMRDRVVVLHQLGNHGPNYFERYPPGFERYSPVCRSPDLGQCSRQQIVNAYDNALAYTDHVLASTIHALAQLPGYDTAMIYVSDHGESLGEKGLYLHGVPYAIAPSEQTHVPMVMWFSSGFASDTGLDLQCVRERAARPASHDYLFDSVLGIMDVRSHVYQPRWDLFSACRGSQVAAAG
ncbi:phosphoethanolamine transferase [Pseudoxanthomonas dokdonensis]|uniref:Membrane protein n=1 Tax=Pseudoxanthomonas dokdonensis TaxID=344882 RepID=A0A0R0CGU3_9GAMM|nr:phosphoethanolamine--lipid A transferase [Pseudoxanthomonas dokdonensis]KRG68310.1 membrane protein [Pseudoxanthomonas dokdonensis]